MPVLFPSHPPAPDTEDERVNAGPRQVQRARGAINLHFWESLSSYITLQAFTTLFNKEDYAREHVTKRDASRIRNYIQAYGVAMQAVDEVWSLDTAKSND